MHQSGGRQFCSQGITTVPAPPGQRGECEANREFAIPLPCNAFLHLMGLPPEELDTFLQLKDGIIRPHMQTTDVDEMGAIRERTGKQIYAYFETLIDERKARPRNVWP